MNILIISNCPLDPSQGSGYVICGFAQRIGDRGNTIHAYGPQDYIFLPKVKPLKRLRIFIGYTVKAISEAWFANNSYDIIELWGGVGWLACFLLIRFRKKHYFVVCRSNGLEPHYRHVSRKRLDQFTLRRFFGFFESWFDSIGFRNADLLTVVSEYDENFALKNNYKLKPNILVLENPLPDDFLCQSKSRIADDFTIGFVGSWISRKGREELIALMNALSKMNSNAKWIVAGVGQQGKSEILQQTSLGPQQIYEQLRREDLIGLYQRMSVFLCLSSYESFGMVSSEAMSSGCLLVSTKVGFTSSLKSGLEYIEIDRTDINSVASTLYHVEKHFSDYVNVAASGYAIVQKLQWSRSASLLEKKYRELAQADEST